jgi:hypothetical protein
MAIKTKKLIYCNNVPPFSAEMKSLIDERLADDDLNPKQGSD